MISKIKTCILMGLEGIIIYVETDISRGMPGFQIVGLAGASIKESKERVKSAIKNSDFDFPISKIIANLSPANIKKEGSHLDLPIAIGILKSSNIIEKKIDEYAFLGELSLDGRILEIDGALPIAISLKKKGVKNLILPYNNRYEAGVIEDINIYPVKNLKELVNFLNGDIEISPFKRDIDLNTSEIDNRIDFKNIKGQKFAKRALEVAASGMHNIIMNGPAGSGKTMLANALNSILPPLSFEEALEITKIYSIRGLNKNREFIKKRPFRSIHHSATIPALCGGGRNAMPGEISLAHNGILFMDEIPEFSNKLIDSLRQPMEDKYIIVSRSDITAKYPSDFMLIATMNPCPCGNYQTELNCECSIYEINRYRRKLSSPILDRIDIQIDIDRIEFKELNDRNEEEDSNSIRKRVKRAHRIQKERFKDERVFFNSQMGPVLIDKYCKLDSNCKDIMELAFERYKLSARAYNKIISLARTIADIENRKRIDITDITEAIQYRNRIEGEE
ncbi:MAG: YifB family Mg chelatase-like AAA ATPase [Andreesenia angusta]|nr:YifB family Mg chelatase-like AAA ATPase [Andreesenia angusta]